MYDYYDEEYDYYEPSEVDRLFDELKEKAKDFIIPSVTRHIEELEKENKDLKFKLKLLQDKEDEVKRDKQSLEFAKNNYKQELESEFKKQKLEDLINPLLEELDVWFACEETYQLEKCDKCNDDRKLVATYPDGTKAEKSCSCAKLQYRYVPALKTLNSLKIVKSEATRYSNKNKFYVTKYNHYDNSYDNPYCDSEVKIVKVFDKYNEEAQDFSDRMCGYFEIIGFTNKEECQKYCNYKNSRK